MFLLLLFKFCVILGVLFWISFCSNLTLRGPNSDLKPPPTHTRIHTFDPPMCIEGVLESRAC